MSFEEKIKPLRDEIDFLDSEILELLYLRFLAVDKVWDLKKEYEVKPLDQNRWDKLLEEKVSKWTEKWMSKEFIEVVWNEIHREALKREE